MTRWIVVALLLLGVSAAHARRVGQIPDWPPIQKVAGSPPPPPAGINRSHDLLGTMGMVVNTTAGTTEANAATILQYTGVTLVRLNTAIPAPSIWTAFASAGIKIDLINSQFGCGGYTSAVTYMNTNWVPGTRHLFE